MKQGKTLIDVLSPQPKRYALIAFISQIDGRRHQRTCRLADVARLIASLSESEETNRFTVTLAHRPWNEIEQPD